MFRYCFLFIFERSCAFSCSVRSTKPLICRYNNSKITGKWKRTKIWQNGQTNEKYNWEENWYDYKLRATDIRYTIIYCISNRKREAAAYRVQINMLYLLWLLLLSSVNIYFIFRLTLSITLYAWCSVEPQQCRKY